MPLDADGAGSFGERCQARPGPLPRRAADVLGTTPAFLRTAGEAGLITPLRSDGGHCRYSRRQLRVAVRATSATRIPGLVTTEIHTGAG